MTLMKAEVGHRPHRIRLGFEYFDFPSTSALLNMVSTIILRIVGKLAILR